MRKEIFPSPIFSLFREGSSLYFDPLLDHRNPIAIVHIYFHCIRKEELKVSFIIESMHRGNGYLKNKLKIKKNTFEGYFV